MAGLYKPFNKINELLRNIIRQFEWEKGRFLNKDIVEGWITIYFMSSFTKNPV